ncbi:MAG TPA: glycosyltransferase [Candidatus Omnitrophota bacterium]|nr:glycosyltransferase [Candidatus Omnitrophota bacterium]
MTINQACHNLALVSVMDILIFAGLAEHKLISKILPLVNRGDVKRIVLLRINPLAHEKVTCVTPPGVLRWCQFLSYVYLFFAALMVNFRCRFSYAIGIHFWPHALLALLVGKIFNRKFVMVLAEEPGYWRNNRLFNYAVRSAYRVGVRGKASREYLLQQGAESGKIFIPPNVFAFSRQAGKESERQYDIIFIGSFTKVKRLDIFLDVIEDLRKRMSDVRVLIVGEGPVESEIKKFINEKSLQRQVTVAGYQRDIYSCLNGSKVFLLTSESEGLPMAVVEAMSAGLPCVVPAVGDITDVARHEDNALVVEPLNVRAFSEACYRLLSDRQFYAKLSENARKIAQEKKDEYSLTGAMGVWEDVLGKER